MTGSELGFLGRVRWGANKRDVEALFPSWDALPPHPSANAIGFTGELFGHLAGAVCYFRKAWFSDKLAKVHIAWWTERPPDETVEATYRVVRQALEAQLGRPPTEMDVAGPAPPEFRQSAMVFWQEPERIITLSCGLVRDGVPASNSPLALEILDPNHDPIGRMLSG